MKFFEGIERSLGYGVFFVHSAVTSALAANKGWGKEIDETISNLGNPKGLRDLSREVEDEVDGALGNIATFINTYLDNKYDPSADVPDVDADTAENPSDKSAEFASALRDFLGNLGNKEAKDAPAETPAADEAPAASASSASELGFTKDELRTLAEANDFAAVAALVKPVVTRYTVAREAGATAEAEALKDALAEAGIILTVSSSGRVTWLFS